MGAILEDAFKPNLVQTLEGVPALVHGGPFANIAHGCSSLIATQTALRCADWVVTEAGFGFDLGAEKFYDIKCVTGGLDTAAVVLVATARALKMHGGVRRKRLAEPNPEALRLGLGNLDKHVESIGLFGEPPIVALNQFEGDTEEEIDVVRARCAELDVPFVVSRHHAQGGEGARDLARLVVAEAETRSEPFRALYAWGDSVQDKILAVAKAMYGADGITLTAAARLDLAEVERLGFAGLPVCMAKTASSLSDDPVRRGRPNGFDVTVRRIRVNAGARFLVVLTGDILRMPGLPRHPRAEEF
jgi:formate--tetrahydrofolate ligase